MAGSAYRLAPWTQVVRPHDDIVSGSLDMGTYAVNVARVFRRNSDLAKVYQDPRDFFAATFLTEKMRELLTETMAVLGGGSGSRVLQLRTPFGGGKSHSLVALLHLARDRQAALSGSDALAGLPDPGPVQVAVLSGEELDRLTPMTTNGFNTHTLWGELAAQLGRYDLVAEHDRTGSAPGGAVLRQVLGDGPTLVLLDEVLLYVEKAMAVVQGESNAGRQAMLFIQALTEAINGHAKAAMVYSLQASVGEAVGAESLLSDLDKLVSRIDAKREPVSGDEVLRVVQRRLFQDFGDEAVRDGVAREYADLTRQQLRAAADSDQARREADADATLLETRVRDSYPFHPELLDLMYHRWGALPSYQRTRGALQFLASAVHGLWQRKATTAPLIGPGDIDLTDPTTRSAFFTQVGEREQYASVVASDIVDATAGAKRVDRQLGADGNATIEQLAVGTRAATAVMLYSFGARQGEDRGVPQTELIRALLAPGLNRNVIVTALSDLREEALYLHFTGRQYRFEPKPNLAKLIRDEATKLDPTEVLDTVQAELESALSTQDRRAISVWPQGPATVDDGRPHFTVVYLHPDWSEHTAPLVRFVEDASGGPRRYRNGLALALPDQAQFDQARHSMRQHIAASALIGAKDRYGFVAEQIEELNEKAETHLRNARAALAKSYGNVSVPVRDRAANAPYTMTTLDLRTMVTAGRSLQERVVSALESHVFTRLVAAKLVSLAGLGPDRKLVSCADLVDWFYSYFEFTKLWNRQAVAHAITDAVAGSEAGYAIGLVRQADTVMLRPGSHVRIGESLRADEIDLTDDAAIIWVDYAHELRKDPSATGGGAPPPGGAQPGGGTPPETGGTGGGTSSGPTPGGGATGAAGGTGGTGGAGPTGTNAIRSATIAARFDKHGLFDLTRALSWLREKATNVTVDVRIQAEGELSRTEFRNGVIEPIEEKGNDVDITTA